MEEYRHKMGENSGAHERGGSFTYVTSSILGPNNSSSPSPSSSSYVGERIPFQACFQHEEGGSPGVKTEGSGTSAVHHQNYFPGFHYPNLPTTAATGAHHHHQPPTTTLFHQQSVGGGGGGENHGTNNNGNHEVEAIKAKIIAHPQYSNLLEAYLDCQKVGAPPEVAARLAATQQEFETRQRASFTSSMDGSKDPELDQFMEAYYDMLVKYREELTRPVQEAMDFMRRIEAQLNVLSNGRVRLFSNGEEKSEAVGSSEEDQKNSGGEEAELPEIDPRAEDRELKNHLLKKYSGYLSSLKQELSKKKKKGKLPKEARQKLLDWWESHYKWPYPSESEKVALAEATGLDQKQINNWFINQRKRHWKPSEDMQFMVMDGIQNHHHPQNTALYMDGHYMGDGPYRFGT